MEENVNAGPSAAEIFADYFKKSQSVIGTLNPNIFWQLYGEANPPADNESSDEGSDAIPK
jgi:hypothetical protein